MNEQRIILSGTRAFDVNKIEEIQEIGTNVEIVANGKMLIWEGISKTEFDLQDFIIKKSTNHYDWLDENLNDFWVNVFGKTLEELGCRGIISAHGDKAYGYKKQWEDSNIPFNHGVAMFLLTYTRLGEHILSCKSQWVIDNYPKYEPLLPKDY